MTVIGHGDVASGIVDNPKFLFFASGVSDSSETRKEQFEREERLLMAQDKRQHVVYFSTLSIFTADTPYTRHKRYMEGVVKANFEKYCIVRLGNVAFGRHNPHTLINHLRDRIELDQPFVIKDVRRHILSRAEFQWWISKIPSFNCEMNCPGEFLHVSEIVSRIQKGEL